MKKTLLIAAALLLIAIVAFIFISGRSPDEPTPTPPLTEEPTAEPETAEETNEPEEIEETTPTEEPAEEPPASVTVAPAPIRKAKKPAPVIIPEKTETPAITEEIPEDAPTIAEETPEETPAIIEETPTETVAETPIETADETPDSHLRRKHSITLSAGLGISAANTSDDLIYKNAYLSDGFKLQNSFVAELAYMYRINNNFGIEPFISYSMEKQSLVSPIGEHTLEHTALAAGANVLGIMPVNNFDIYALAGLLYIHNNFDFSSDTNASYNETGGSLGIQGGIGADYIFNNRIRAGLRGVYRYNKPSIDNYKPNTSKFIFTARLGVDF